MFICNKPVNAFANGLHEGPNIQPPGIKSVSLDELNLTFLFNNNNQNEASFLGCYQIPGKNNNN